jgi:hypothetical protein
MESMRPGESSGLDLLTCRIEGDEYPALLQGARAPMQGEGACV